MRKILPLVLLIGILFSCGKDINTKQSPQSESPIPKLLDRPSKVQLEEEWDVVQNRYAKLRSELQEESVVPSVYLQLAELFINEARITGEHGHYYPAALAVVERALGEATPGSDDEFRALTLKASVLLSQHDFRQALLVGQQAVRLNAYNAAIYGVLVDAYVELGEYDKAVAMADKMVSIRPDLRSYARVSYLREIHGDPHGAMKAMEMAVAAGAPGYEQLAWTRCTLGDLYQQYGKLDAAEKQFQLALQERKDYPFAISGLAAIAIERQELDRAEMLLHRACSIIPEVGFYEQLRSVYQLKGEQVKASDLKNTILEMLADDVAHGHNMNMEYATFYLDQQNIQAALTYAKKEYQVRPNNIDVNKLLAKIYLARDEPKLATIHRVKAMRTGSKDPELMDINKQFSQTH